MSEQLFNFDMSLMCLILKNHEADKAMNIARENGLNIGTIFHAHGTSKQKIWRVLGLDDVLLECLIIAGPGRQISQLLSEINDVFHFEKPHNGVGFSVPLSSVRGANFDDYTEENTADIKRNGGENMYEAIVTIVDRGQAELVVEIGDQAGAQGGTILHGRGTARKAKKIFNMEINPEKEIVLTIVPQEKTAQITQALFDGLGLDEPNSGILFTLDLDETYGIS